jgi:hypothetical protein
MVDRGARWGRKKAAQEKPKKSRRARRIGVETIATYKKEI